MTYTEAYALARHAANITQLWFEIWVFNGDYRVINQGSTLDGYTHYMSISPERKIEYGATTETPNET